MSRGLWEWLAKAPFGDDMYFMVSLDALQKLEAIGQHIVATKTNYCSQPEQLAPPEPLVTIAGKRTFCNQRLAPNEIRLFNSFGLQAVFLLKPPAPDLKTPEPNHITWPSPQMNT